MGLIGNFFGMIFGDGRNAIVETVEVFRENAEKSSARDADFKTATLAQFAAEFAHERKGLFDRFVDALNRLPRPLLAGGTIALFVSAMSDPEWFSTHMAGIALVPEPLWWLMGAVVSFYFGARHQIKAQEFQRSVVDSIALSTALAGGSRLDPAAIDTDGNAALAEWQSQNE